MGPVGVALGSLAVSLPLLDAVALLAVAAAVVQIGVLGVVRMSRWAVCLGGGDAPRFASPDVLLV
jgi:hypothetical protein